MAKVEFKSNERYQDYDANLYFDACGFTGVRYALKKVMVDETPTVLVHVRATMPDGQILETDIWPRNEATAEDLAVETIDNFEFRIGFYADEKTGEVTTGAPKHLLCHGEKRAFNA